MTGVVCAAVIGNGPSFAAGRVVCASVIGNGPSFAAGRVVCASVIGNEPSFAAGRVVCATVIGNEPNFAAEPGRLRDCDRKRAQFRCWSDRLRDCDRKRPQGVRQLEAWPHDPSRCLAASRRSGLIPLPTCHAGAATSVVPTMTRVAASPLRPAAGVVDTAPLSLAQLGVCWQRPRS
jgi:hypothetical protein